MMLDFFFRRPRLGKPRHREPTLAMPGEKDDRATTPKHGHAAGRRAALSLSPPEPTGDVRQMSPRQMAGWAHELYVAGVIGWAEYSIAIPVELHPDYNRTVGALTGEPADPDKPRDMLEEWEERLAFMRRHNAWNDIHLRRTERILRLLRRNIQTGGWIGG